jgi:hypothetical protein
MITVDMQIIKNINTKKKVDAKWINAALTLNAFDSGYILNNKRMENIIFIRRLAIEKKANNRYLYTVETLGTGNYSIISDNGINTTIEQAKSTEDEELIYNTVIDVCKKILNKNYQYFKNLEII